MGTGETYTVWTRQVSQVWDEIQETGTYSVREEYVRAKNDTISDYYLGLYRWLTDGCRRIVSGIPAAAQYPIWLSMTQGTRLGATEGAISLTLEIPKDEVFLLDYDKWGYRVNYWYVPKDEADERAFNEELQRLGIGSEALLINSNKGNFYPAQKNKIIRSWSRVFDGPNEDMEHNVGLVWEIKREWVKDVEFYDGE